MALPSFCRETVTVLRAPLVDQRGTKVRDWSAAESHRVPGCSVQFASTTTDRGEPREAVVALSMLQQGNWVLPVNNGVELAFKPPFFHWCIAAISAVAGAVNEYTARMPSALALMAMVLVGYVFFAKRRGTEVAFLAALITLTNFEVHRAGVACRVDMVLKRT